MFNSSLKKEAIKIHDDILQKYNESHSDMSFACEKLYETRQESIGVIEFIENVVNSIANTPKEFDTQMGEIKGNIQTFKETEKYANEAYQASLKTGVGIATGTVAGVATATMAPAAMMSIATTFGTATTGTAISALSGAAAQKAAVAWIGRTFAGFAVKQGAGMAAGQAFLALAGPIGWSIAAGSTALSLVSLTKKNKDIADDAVKEAKDIDIAREGLDEATVKIKDLIEKTSILYEGLSKQHDEIERKSNTDYASLSSEEKYFLGSVVNNTYSLSKLVVETIG